LEEGRLSLSTLISSRRRRAILLIALVLSASLLSLVIMNAASRATSGGSPYDVPVVSDTNPDPNIVETTLTAENATVEVGPNGRTANAETFNGQIPGPTFDLKVGDTVIVHFKNNLSSISGIHWHGIELSNSMDGTPFTQNQVNPGGNFLYKFTVTRPGIFWYHPHHASSTNQVFKGLYGMIVVHDPNETALQNSGTLPSAGQTKQIVLSDTTVCHGAPNDAATYNSALPHVSGGALSAQARPVPKDLCDGGTVANGGGTTTYPVDENGNTGPPFGPGDIPNIQTANHAGRVNEGQTVLTNGKNVGGRAGGPCAVDPPATPTCPPQTPPGALDPGASLLNVQPGQGLRLQLLNASAVRYMRLQLTKPDGTQVPLVRVGGEGGLLDKALVEGGTQGSWVTNYLSGEILLPPGSRADVVAAIPSSPTTGVMTLWTEDYKRVGGGGYADVPTVPVMHLNLSGPTVSPAYSISAGTPLRNATGNPVQLLGPATGTLLNPSTFSPPKTGCHNVAPCPTISNINLQQAATEAQIDGTFGTHDIPGSYELTPHLGSSRYAKEGDILQLTVTNGTSAHHPFHLHGFSIQPITLSNGAQTFNFDTSNPEFRDNIDIPGGFTLTFRVKLDPRPQPDGTTAGGALGRWVFHCHIFFHAEDGMLSELVITAPNGNERPDVNVDNSEATVTQGQTATVTGTYKDPDGDPVTLASSVGTVSNNGTGANGIGSYTWTFPTTGSTGSQIVYVTATDSNGLKGQIPFSLKVNGTPNTAPVLKKLKVVPKTFKPSAKKTKVNATISKKAKRGAKIKFNLSEAATVKFTVKKLKPKKPKLKKPTSFSRTVKSGGNKVVKFSGRIKNRKLPPGKYKLIAQATDSGGLKSKSVTTKFKIVRH
jgi:FtsP/CotA-like multicopper oxidase with cupredoxin domain